MRNKTYYISIVLICLGLIGMLAGCARPVELKPAITQEFNYNDFSSVEVGLWSPVFLSFGNTLNIPIGLDVVKADSYKMEITANENIFDFIHISQSGKSLKVLIDRNRIGNENATLNIKIGMPQLEGLKLSGGVMRANVFSSAADFAANVSGSSKLTIDMQTGKTSFNIGSSSVVIASGSVGDLQAQVSGSSRFTSNVNSTSLTYVISSSSDVVTNGTTGALNAEVSSSSSLDMSLESGDSLIKVSSSSDVTGNLKAADLQIEANSSSRIDLKGSAPNAVLKASSSSDIVMPQFVLNSAAVTLNGSSEANIQVSQHLDVNLSSSSHLTYTGQPVMGDVKVSGASDITHK